MSDPIRVRFAPSPTGFMHIGSVHTAMFNYLFARNQGGKFVLRIEDTDEVRSTEASVGVIYSGLKWLEMDWDEGPDVGGPHAPYVQSERLDIYRQHLDRLLAEGKAYKCYCTREDLEEQRRIQQARSLPPRYDGRCRLVEDRPGVEHCVRLKVAETGKTVIHDLIQGEVVNENALVGDPVIGKTSGFPTFHFAVVVDDALMQISHVIRAADHVPNTQIHVQLQDALGFPRPQYAHLPLILGTDRTKLGKRHGSVSVVEYQEQGYLPEALFNFLALLGWSPGSEEQEVFSREELIARFELERINRAPASFSYDKLDWMNGVYIRNLPVPQLAARIQPVLVAAGFDASPALAEQIVPLIRERIKTLNEVVPMTDFFFSDPQGYDPALLLGKKMSPAVARTALERAAQVLAGVDFTEEALDGALRAGAESLGLKAGDFFTPIRVAVTGKAVSPPLFGALVILGRDRVLKRLSTAIGMLPDNSQS